MFTFLVFAEASEDDVYGTGCYFNKVHIDFTSIFKCGNTTVVFMALIFRGGAIEYARGAIMAMTW